ncbi:MAG: flagellar hook protein [Desulfovibrio sp.]|uniref:flagellin n=1 Tax=Desulfovibrio sp. TaxID=885 RepID=UPI0039E3795C
MAIRVTQSSMYNTMVGQMQKNLSAYMESNEQGSTQKKINRPSDDPAGTYRVLMTRDDISDTKQYQTNCDTAKGWLSLADDVLGTQLSTTMTKLKSLMEQASTGTTADQRKLIAAEAKEIFGQILNLSNTQFNDKSIFGGQRYDQNAFEQGLALTSWDTNWDSQISQGNYTIDGASSSSMMVQFVSNGTLGVDPLNYRWSKDGGETWTTATVAAGSRTLVADGVTMTMDQNIAVSAADTTLGAGAKNGTLVYIRPTAVYQGDDNDPPPEMTVMGGPANLKTSASGVFGNNVLVRMDSTVDLSSTGTSFNYSYSLDSGGTWVTATAQTSGSGTVRLPVPGGYMDMDATPPAASTTIDAGTQMLIHPARANLNLEIMKGTYISVNNVGKDIFGGYYQGQPALEGSANLFEVVGDFVAYCENNNQEGCQKSLAAIEVAQQNILGEEARIGGLENRVSMAQDVLSFQRVDQEERLSYTEDIDLTELLAKLTRQQLTYQTVLQSSSMIMQLSLAKYI